MKVHTYDNIFRTTRKNMFMVFKFNNQQKDIVAKLIEDKE